jgi:hypothetical protein
MKTELPPADAATTWEQLWAPYDEATYQAVLAAIHPEDIILEIGAGDLRLAIRAAAISRQVYAIEIQEAILERAFACDKLPVNLFLIHGDARDVQYPRGITTALLLMRHCTHFDLYVKKLQAVGCRTLITNARWRSGVEVIDLQATRTPYDELVLGWYTCLCGSAGFKPGAVELLTDEISNTVVEVNCCPVCRLLEESKYRKEDDPEIQDLPKNLDGSEGPITFYLEGARAK